MSPVAAERLQKIGEVANASGLSVKTIRYYEDLGLLAPTVKRARSSYRLFYPSVFQRLAFIKRAQSLGLSLEEIREILVTHDSGEVPCDVVKQHLSQKLEAIAQQIEALKLLKVELEAILSSWHEKPSQEQLSRTICPNIQSEL